MPRLKVFLVILMCVGNLTMECLGTGEPRPSNFITRSQTPAVFWNYCLDSWLISFCFGKSQNQQSTFSLDKLINLSSLHFSNSSPSVNQTKLPYWSPHYARNHSGSCSTPWPSRKWHLPRSPYPLPEPLVEWSHGGAGSESKSWNLSWQQPQQHNASKVLHKGVGKNPKTWDPWSSQNHVILPPFEFGASFWWTVSAYKKTCRTSPKLHTILLKSQHPRSHLFHLAAEPKEHQDWHPNTSLPPTDIIAVSACIRWRQVSPVIHAVPCQVSGMYDVTSTCLNMFAWTPSNTYHTSGRVKGDDTGKLCDVQAPVLLVVLLARQFAMRFPQALEAHWNVDSQLNWIQRNLITDSPLSPWTIKLSTCIEKWLVLFSRPRFQATMAKQGSRIAALIQGHLLLTIRTQLSHLDLHFTDPLLLSGWHIGNKDTSGSVWLLNGPSTCVGQQHTQRRSNTQCEPTISNKFFSLEISSTTRRFLAGHWNP